MSKFKTMAELGLQSPTGLLTQMEDREPRWRGWALILALALLLHLGLLFLKYDWSSPAPAKVEVQQIDPRKLEAIRRQWRKQPQSLLLNKDKSQPSAKEAPPEARFMSDRNIKVEKEQRARQTQVIPKPGSVAQPRPEARQNQPQSKTKNPARKLPSLGNLGVPFHLDRPAAPQPREAPAPSQAGGDQAIDDPRLAEGSENILNAQESVYYSFYARIYETIGPLWQSNIQGVPSRRAVAEGDYRTVVDVVLDREGNLIAVNRLQGSGITEFDSAVDNAWRKIGKFPNPPKGLLNERGEIHTGWTFLVRLSRGIGLQSAPPSRNY